MVQPYFKSFADFVHMNGHGSYVWTCWLLTVMAIIVLTLYSRYQRQQTKRYIGQQQARQAQRQAVKQQVL